MKKLCLLLVGAMLAGLIWRLTHPTPHVTREGFERLKPNMTIEQVEAILGKPSRCDRGEYGALFWWEGAEGTVIGRGIDDHGIFIAVFRSKEGEETVKDLYAPFVVGFAPDSLLRRICDWVAVPWNWAHPRRNASPSTPNFPPQVILPDLPAMAD